MTDDATDAGLLGRIVPDRVRRSYLLKFALATAVVLLAVGLVGYGVQAHTSETLRGDVEESLTQQTESEAASLSELIDNKRQPARFVSDDGVFRDGTDEEIRSYLRDERESKLSESVRNVHFIDTREQRVVTSTDADRVGDDVSDAAWFRWYAFDDFDDVVVSDPYEGDDGDSRIAVVSPVPGVFNGAVVVTHDVADIEDRFQSHVNGTFTRVVDSGGTVLFADDDAETLAPYLDDEEARSEAIADGSEGGSGFVDDPAVTEQRDDDYVLAYAPVAGTDWTVVKASPADNAYLLAQDVESGVLLLLAVALVGVVAIGATIGRNTANAVRELSERAAAVEAGNYDVTVRSGRVDEIGKLYDSIGGMRDGLVTRIEEADEAQADAEAARREAEALSDRLETAAAAYGETMAECADGDLTRRLDPDVESDAMRDVACSFNDMLDEWEETVVTIQSFADAVESTSSETEAGVDEIETASREVSQAAETITDATREQREQVESVSREMSDLSATVEEITSTAETVAATADGTATAGETGRDAAGDAVEELAAIREQTERAIDSVERLDERMTAIGEVAEVIGDIAEETNILALNANIEAARATDGNDGEGFAVVADEVKALAEETKASAEEIESRIEEVTDQTERTVSEMREVGERVDDGTETVSEALDALDEIADRADETNAGVQEIRGATDQQAEAAQEVSSMTDRVAEIADDTSRETENVAAAAQQQTAQVEEMSDRIDDLSRKVTELRAELSEFETGDGAEFADGDPTASDGPAASGPESAISGPDPTDTVTDGGATNDH